MTLNLVSNQTIVVTGSSGFVGEALAISLKNLGLNVIGVDLKKSDRLDCKQIILNLVEEDLSESLPSGAIIVHLASLSTDSLCRENPVLAVDANLKATANIVQTAKKISSRHLIFASSEWVYPEKSYICSQSETDSLSLSDLNSIYAISKLVGESIIRTTSVTPYSLLRFGIVYGPRKVPGSAAENIALKVMNEEVIQVGSAHTSRRFIYLEDLIGAILSVLEFGPVSNDGTALNIAGPELISLVDIVESTSQILQKPHNFVDLGGFPSIRNPVIDRATNLLGWKPKTSFSVGIFNCLNTLSSKS
jgi:nucleoside-diphosphate-sugar epimerase